MSTVSRRRRGRRLAIVAALFAVTLGPSTQAALADSPHPTPTAGHDLRQSSQQLQKARQKAQAEQRALEAAKQSVVVANEQLTARAAEARAAIHRYAATMREVSHARKQAAAAEVLAAAATARATRQQDRVQGFARAAYMSGGPLTSLAIVLSADAPRAILNRASLLDQVAQSQAAVLHALAAAQREQAIAVEGALAAQRAVEQLAAKADIQRRAALVSMANQQALLQQLSDAQARAAARVADQQKQVAALVQQRAAARRAQLAAQRALLAAAWASMQAVGDSMPWATPEQGRQVVAAARQYLGTPYSWGGGDAKGPTLGFVNDSGDTAGLHTIGFDCSGLALYAWGKVGFTLDHFTGYQWVEGHHIALADLRAGDLVFFAKNVSDPLTIHHVGIYVGGNRMIDAPHTGADVRYDDVFVPGLIGAVRP